MTVQLQLSKVLRLTHQEPILIIAVQIQFIRFQLFFLRCGIRDILKTHLLVLIT